MVAENETVYYGSPETKHAKTNIQAAQLSFIGRMKKDHATYEPNERFFNSTNKRSTKRSDPRMPEHD